MKKVMFLLAGLFVASLSQAQQTDNKPPVKKIEVTGSAEIEITPDEIYLDIALREFKNKTVKVEMATLEAQLQKAVKEAGIPASDLTIANVFGTNYDNWWSKKKKDPDFMARKQYRLKLSNLDKVNDILGAVDAEGIESVNISSYTHSKMEDYRKQVKTKALQAAKAKATYMLEGIGSTIDGVLEVQEINTDNYADVPPAVFANSFARAANAESADASSFKKIKVRAEVRAVFFIK